MEILRVSFYGMGDVFLMVFYIGCDYGGWYCGWYDWLFFVKDDVLFCLDVIYEWFLLEFFVVVGRVVFWMELLDEVIWM